MGRGARERGRERVAAEEQAGARGGQARGVVEERVGSEEGEEHGEGEAAGGRRDSTSASTPADRCFSPPHQLQVEQ